MKTLPVLTFIAALVAFVSLPFKFETTVGLAFIAGLAALMISDYTRRTRPVRVSAVASVARPGRTERFGLAA